MADIVQCICVVPRILQRFERPDESIAKVTFLFAHYTIQIMTEQIFRHIKQTQVLPE